MQTDKVILKVAGVKMEHFVSYEITSDMHAPEAPFSIELGYLPKAKEGDRCEIWVNGFLELTGIIDSVSESGDKSTHNFKIAGRSLIGLLADTCVQEFKPLPKRLKTMAAKLVKGIPFVSAKNFEFWDGAESADIDSEHTKLNIGDTVFNVLREAAISRGLLFYAYRDGTLIFGKPRASGKVFFKAINLASGQGNNVVRFSKDFDISKLNSSITVINDNGKDHGKYTVTNPTAPVKKPLVVAYNAEGGGVKKQAMELLRQQKVDAYQLSYTFAGHSQGNENYRINKLIEIQDEIVGVSGIWLIRSRVFRRDRSGTFTDLKIGPKGINEKPAGVRKQRKK